jgi:hypothetical protein
MIATVSRYWPRSRLRAPPCISFRAEVLKDGLDHYAMGARIADVAEPELSKPSGLQTVKAPAIGVPA